MPRQAAGVSSASASLEVATRCLQSAVDAVKHIWYQMVANSGACCPPRRSLERRLGAVSTVVGDVFEGGKFPFIAQFPREDVPN